MKRVVITGQGAITPVGNNIKEYWKNLLNGVSGADRITRFDPSPFKTDFACEIKDYDPLDYFDRKEARRLDRFSQYGLIAAEEAMDDASLNAENVHKERTGVIFSSGIGGFETFESDVLENFTGDKTPRISPFFITKIIANGIAGQLSIKYGLRGINYSPVTACASSTNGLVQAFNYIKWNKADMFIVGGSEAPITKSSIGGFNSMKALSTNNDNFETASRPFDISRDGFVIGEGAGALVVESLESAIKRDAKIYAEIVGGGETSDAYHITGTHPEGLGAYLAMKNAIQEGVVTPSEVDYINAHATSTVPGDLSEIKAIERLFAGHLEKITVSASKSITGHLLGAAGAVEAISTCMSIHEDVIPPTINTIHIDEEIPTELNLLLKEKSEQTVDYAISNSFGFGGHCAAVLMKKFSDE